MSRVVRAYGFVVLMGIALAPAVSAQEERGRVSGAVSAALGDGGPAPAIGVAGGFQLAPHAGFEIEVLYIPDQDFADRNDFVIASGLTYRAIESSAPSRIGGVSTSLIFPTPQISTRGRTVAFLSSFVADLPVGRLRPYAQLGGGIANVERRISIRYPGPIPLLSSIPGAPAQLIPIIIPPARYTIAENDLALTAGAGLEIRVWKRLSVAADVRYLRLFPAGTRGSGQLENITRIGARASWWF